MIFFSLKKKEKSISISTLQKTKPSFKQAITETSTGMGERNVFSIAATHLLAVEGTNPGDEVRTEVIPSFTTNGEWLLPGCKYFGVKSKDNLLIIHYRNTRTMRLTK